MPNLIIEVLNVNSPLVRLKEIILEGFKNINYGVIQMPSALSKSFAALEPDILGIYGQNGSGKTAVVEAMSFVNNLLMGVPLPPDSALYISNEQEQCVITVCFDIKFKDKASKVEYGVELIRSDDNSFNIKSESLSSKNWNRSAFGRKKLLLKVVTDSEGAILLPNYRYEELYKNNEKNKINLGVAFKLAFKEHLSFIFNDESKKVFFSASNETTAEYMYIIKSLISYVSTDLFIIENSLSGYISLNLLPLVYHQATEDGEGSGTLPISLEKPTSLDIDNYNLLKKIVSELNSTLSTLIPGLSIDIHVVGKPILKNGSLGYAIQLISKRGDVKIPLQYESEGIIKILSMLNALMYVFNNPSSCVLIDELDSGIFEYLLGELLSFFSKNAKGQMIFTSHNLRALEVLPKTSVLFSTANPNNRFIRLQDVKKNNNLRDFYLRSIRLGGQPEEIYAETDTNEISRAFRRVGRTVKNGEEN
jgi:AAA15 family ATPase/GTPase